MSDPSANLHNLPCCTPKIEGRRTTNGRLGLAGPEAVSTPEYQAEPHIERRLEPCDNPSLDRRRVGLALLDNPTAARLRHACEVFVRLPDCHGRTASHKQNRLAKRRIGEGRSRSRWMINAEIKSEIIRHARRVCVERIQAAISVLARVGRRRRRRDDQVQANGFTTARCAEYDTGTV